MPRPKHRLSHRLAQTLTKPGLHADGDGLYLEVDSEEVDAAGKPQPQLKRWTYIYRWRGKRKQLGLGPFSDIGVAEARKKAEAAKAHLLNGLDPKDQRDAEKRRSRAPTFSEAAEALLKTLDKELAHPTHRRQWRRSLMDLANPLADIPVDEVTTDQVLDVLTPIWNETPDMAGRTRGRIERVLDAAKARGHRTGENPARWRGHLAVLLPKRSRKTVRHHPALPFGEVAAFVAELRSREAVAARALEFTILTAARTGETIGATWSEIDLAAKVWTIPAGRMKMGVEHRVPLTGRAVAILRDLLDGAEQLGRTRPADPVFLSPDLRRPLSNAAMEMLLRRMNSDVTVHGFRSTFRDWAGEATEFPRELAEAALAHKVGDAVEQAYRRGDALEKRRRLMEDWATHCTLRPPDKERIDPHARSLMINEVRRL